MADFSRVRASVATVMAGLLVMTGLTSAAALPPDYGRFGHPLDAAPSGLIAGEAERLAAAGRQADAQSLASIAAQPTAAWFGGWNQDVDADVRAVVASASRRNSIATLVAYNIPQRDCGGESAGGAATMQAYMAWIEAFRRGLGSTPSIVVLEPDGLAQLDCLSASDGAVRVRLLSYAVTRLSTQGSFVYVDAGNSAWRDPVVMAKRLKLVGVHKAAGFSLNVSNFRSTTDETLYGTRISKALGRAKTHFVIDTSRNGVPPVSTEWCNPPGRGLGEKPTVVTTSPLIDAYLWVKRPGESDGACNGGPSAGTFWTEYAIELARNARQ